MRQLLRFVFFGLLVTCLGHNEIYAAQLTTATVTVQVPGSYIFSGHLAGTGGGGLRQLIAIDTVTGESVLIDENTADIYDPKWNHQGTHVAYLDGTTTAIMDISAEVKTTLSLPIGYFPQAWSSDGGQILFIAYDFSVQPEQYRLQIYDINNGSLSTVLSYAVGQSLDNLPLPALPPDITELNFYLLKQASWNPVYTNWFFVQLVGIGTSIEPQPLINLNMLYNVQSGQVLPLDQLVQNISTTPIRWSANGRYLYVNSEQSIAILRFNDAGGNGEVSLIDSAGIENYSALYWVGAGDLLLAVYHDSLTKDKVYHIGQTINNDWYSIEFFRLPYHAFDQVGFSDWHLGASEAEKQALTCLFDVALPTRLTVGMQAQVIVAANPPLHVRDEPLVYSDAVTSLTQDTVVEVLNGPMCANGFRWWQVRLVDGRIGWIPEADQNIYYIEPLGSLPPIAHAGLDQTITDNDSNSSELVTLDGSGSSDPDGTIVSYVWTENDVEIATGVFFTGVGREM